MEAISTLSGAFGIAAAIANPMGPRRAPARTEACARGEDVAPDAAMPAPRLYYDKTLAPGARIDLDAGRSRKLTAVLRLGAGADVLVFNESDGEWRAEIEGKAGRGLAAVVRECLRAPHAVRDLDLVFAPLKRDATDLIIEKATELGVRRIRPVITARTIAETVRLERFKLIARAAAEQTERFDLPEFCAPIPFARLLGEWEAPRVLIFADEAGDAPDQPWGGETGRAPAIAETLHSLRAAPSLALLVGPEGGFRPDERRALRSVSCVAPVSLGPRVLRAETAAIAALAIIQAEWGDWRGP